MDCDYETHFKNKEEFPPISKKESLMMRIQWMESSIQTANQTIFRLTNEKSILQIELIGLVDV